MLGESLKSDAPTGSVGLVMSEMVLGTGVRGMRSRR